MNISPKRGKMVNGFDPAKADQLDARTRDFVDRRARLLGPAYRLFYSDPVEFSRANGVFMYDADGNEYLDAYNNVVSVGHCHPHVIAAIAEQMNTLCTHTRYMQDGILAFAEKLLATFEDEIGHVMFTCTGSEVNQPIRRTHRILVMLNHKNRIPNVPQPNQSLNQTGIISLMQPNRRLIQNIQNPRQSATHLRCQTDPLCLATTQRTR